MTRRSLLRPTDLLLAALFLACASGALATIGRTGAVAPLLIAAQEGVIAALALCRRTAVTPQTHHGTSAVALAWAGTLLPLLLRGDHARLGLLTLGGILQGAGALLALAATLTLGRSFGVVAANRGVRTCGLYRLVRHPIYAAYLLASVGVVLSQPSLSNVAVLLIWTGVQAGRVWLEERVLASDPTYRAYAARVRYRLLPGVW